MSQGTGAPKTASTIGHNVIVGENLFRLVKQHKEQCDRMCDVSLALMLPLYESLMRRTATDAERKEFM